MFEKITVESFLEIIKHKIHGFGIYNIHKTEETKMKCVGQDFPGGQNSTAHTRNMDSILGLGRFHVPWGNKPMHHNS